MASRIGTGRNHFTTGISNQPNTGPETYQSGTVRRYVPGPHGEHHRKGQARRGRIRTSFAAVPAGPLHPDLLGLPVQLRHRRGGAGGHVHLAVPAVADGRAAGFLGAGHRPHQGRERLAHRPRRDPGQEPFGAVVAGARYGRPALRRAAVADPRQHPGSRAGGVVRAGAGEGEPRLHAQRAGEHVGQELHAAVPRVRADLPGTLRGREGRPHLQGRQAVGSLGRHRPADRGRAGGGRRGQRQPADRCGVEGGGPGSGGRWGGPVLEDRTLRPAARGARRPGASRGVDVAVRAVFAGSVRTPAVEGDRPLRELERGGAVDRRPEPGHRAHGRAGAHRRAGGPGLVPRRSPQVADLVHVRAHVRRRVPRQAGRRDAVDLRRGAGGLRRGPAQAGAAVARRGRPGGGAAARAPAVVSGRRRRSGGVPRPRAGPGAGEGPEHADHRPRHPGRPAGPGGAGAGAAATGRHRERSRPRPPHDGQRDRLEGHAGGHRQGRRQDGPRLRLPARRREAGADRPAAHDQEGQLLHRRRRGHPRPHHAEPVSAGSINAADERSLFWGMTRYQWTVLLAAWLGWGFDVFDGLLFNYVAPNCIPTLLGLPIGSVAAKKATLFWCGTRTSVLLLGWAAGGSLFGAIADRIGRTRTLLLTMLFYAFGTAACAAAPNLPVLIVFRIIASLGIGGEWAAGAAMVAEVVPARRRVEAGALLYTSAPAGLFLATFANFQIAGGFMKASPETSWRYVFLCGLLPAVVAFAIRLFVHEPDAWKRAAASAPPPRLRELFSPAVRRLTLSGFAMSLVALITWWTCAAFLAIVASGLAQAAAKQRGLDLPGTLALVESWKARTTNFFNLGGLLGTWLTIPAAKVFGRRKMFGIYYALSAVATFATFGLDLTPETRLV